MTIPELVLLALGLAMDAFAVSVCKGLALRRIRARDALLCGVWFGGFQALMPVIGYFLGTLFAGFIRSVDHWIAFVLLCLIGGNMLREAFSGGDEEPDARMDVRSMFLMAVATSIDALAIGVTFAFLSVNIALAVGLIGVITFALSAVGVKVGSIFGAKYEKRAEMLGGAVLIILGLKILLEHLGVLG